VNWHARYTQQANWTRELREYLFQRTGLMTAGPVLEVGCGTGANIAALAEEYHCVGIDTSQQAIDLARRHSPGVEFLRGTAPDDLGEYAVQARLFLLMDVLEHVADDFEMLVVAEKEA